MAELVPALSTYAAPVGAPLVGLLFRYFLGQRLPSGLVTALLVTALPILVFQLFVPLKQEYYKKVDEVERLREDAERCSPWPTTKYLDSGCADTIADSRQSPLYLAAVTVVQKHWWYCIAFIVVVVLIAVNLVLEWRRRRAVSLPVVKELLRKRAA